MLLVGLCTGMLRPSTMAVTPLIQVMQQWCSRADPGKSCPLPSALHSSSAAMHPRSSSRNMFAGATRMALPTAVLSFSFFRFWVRELFITFVKHTCSARTTRAMFRPSGD